MGQGSVHDKAVLGRSTRTLRKVRSLRKVRTLRKGRSQRLGKNPARSPYILITKEIWRFFGRWIVKILILWCVYQLLNEILCD